MDTEYVAKCLPKPGHILRTVVGHNHIRDTELYDNIFRNTEETYGVVLFVIGTARVNLMHLSVITIMNWLSFLVFGNFQSRKIAIP